MIDVHTHVVPSGLPFGHDERFPVLVDDGDTGRVIVRGSVFRTVRRPAWEAESRVGELDARDVGFQVLSPMPELFGYWAEPAIGASFCAALNDAVAAMVAVAPFRFGGFGAAPLQDVDLAIEALAQVKQLGLLGVQIGSNVAGVSAGSPRFLPFFQAAADLGLAVFVHAFHPPHWECVPDGPMAAAVSFPPEIGTCMAAIVANGFVEQSPGLRLGASHGGGTLPLHLPRMRAFWSWDDERTARASSPDQATRSMWFDCLTYEPAALHALVDLVGVDRIIVGSDYPFFDERPGYVVDAAELHPADRDSIRVANAEAFLGLSKRPGESREHV